MNSDVIMVGGAETTSSIHVGSSGRKRAVFAASIGNILEWYDFVLYAYFSTYIAQAFFPAGNEITSFLIALATFGVGFVARPLGAIVLGTYADRFGRKAALMLIVFLMAIGTGLIGVTPSFERIGLWAPALIVCARLLQGFSSGGEWGSATTFVVEHAPPPRRGLYGSWQQASLAVALLLGSLTGALMISVVEPAQLKDWGWRIPFLVGAIVIGPFGIWLRGRVEESPRYSVGNQGVKGSFYDPIRLAFSGHLSNLLIGAGFTVGWTVTNYLYLVYMTIYLTRTLQVPALHALLAASAQVTVFMLLSPVMGHLSDIVGRRLVMGAGAVCIVLGTYPLFAFMAANPNLWSILPVVCVLGAFMATMTGPAPAWQAELYPSAIRTTSISLSYNIAVTIFGGFAPFVATWLIAVTGNVLSLTYYISAGALLSLVMVYVSKETSRSELG